MAIFPYDVSENEKTPTHEKLLDIIHSAIECLYLVRDSLRQKDYSKVIFYSTQCIAKTSTLIHYSERVSR